MAVGGPLEEFDRSAGIPVIQCPLCTATVGPQQMVCLNCGYFPQVLTMTAGNPVVAPNGSLLASHR